MQYLMLLANAPDEWDSPDARPDDGVIDDWGAYTRALESAGVLVAGAGLAGRDAATTVRLRKGERLVTDGPFAEVKEHIIGYYIIDVADLDAALEWAAKVPNVRTGSVELRPIPADQTIEHILAQPVEAETVG